MCNTAEWKKYLKKKVRNINYYVIFKENQYAVIVTSIYKNRNNNNYIERTMGRIM